MKVYTKSSKPNSSKPKMAIVVCPKLIGSKKRVPALEKGECWANLTADGKYRCTICGSTAHPLIR